MVTFFEEKREYYKDRIPLIEDLIASQKLMKPLLVPSDLSITTTLDAIILIGLHVL